MQQIQDSPNFLISAVKFDFARYSNFQFSATTSSISSIRNSMQTQFFYTSVQPEKHCFPFLHFYPDTHGGHLVPFKGPGPVWSLFGPLTFKSPFFKGPKVDQFRDI